MKYEYFEVIGDLLDDLSGDTAAAERSHRSPGDFVVKPINVTFEVGCRLPN